MRIDQIPIDGSVELVVKKNDRSSTIPAQVLRSKPNMIILKPIMVDGKVLTINDQDMIIDLMYSVENARPFLWRGVSYAMVKINNQSHVVLADKSEGVSLNRRNTFRLDLDIQGILNDGERVVVHDISSTGISFYTKKEDRKVIGDAFKLKFIGGYEEIHVKGVIVREIVEETRNMYGCTITPNPVIDTFMSDEQRRRVMRSRLSNR